jgi:hypothetical protein
MDIRNQINEKFKEAFIAKNSIAKNTLSSIKNAILVEETKGARTVLGDNDILVVVKRLVKQRKESIDDFKNGGREDLVVNELAELAILEQFLPSQMSIDEINSEVKNIISTIVNPSVKSMGQVMKEFNVKFPNMADGKILSNAVKEQLVAIK